MNTEKLSDKKVREQDM